MAVSVNCLVVKGEVGGMDRRMKGRVWNAFRVKWFIAKLASASNRASNAKLFAEFLELMQPTLVLLSASP